MHYHKMHRYLQGAPPKFLDLLNNWSQGYCVQTALNTSFALLSPLENRRQLCVCFDLKSAVKSCRRTIDVYSLLLQIRWLWLVSG